jgi:hypothetical protein
MPVLSSKNKVSVMHGSVSKVSVVGEGAKRARMIMGVVLACVVLLAPAVARAEFGVVPGSFQASATNAAGEPDVQAASHPFALTTSFQFNQTTNYLGETGGDGAPKDIVAAQPAGLAGDPFATPRCTQEEFLAYVPPHGTLCRDSTVVGEVALSTTTLARNFPFTLHFPLYNLVPRPGVAAEFGFVALYVPVTMSFTVRSGGDYGLTANLNDISESLSLTGSTVTIWGVPGDPAHDPYRGSCLGLDGGSNGVCPSGVSPRALLTMPSSCGMPLTTGLSVDAWANPGLFLDQEASAPALEGCEHLDFSPSIAVAPESRVAGAPTGLGVDLHVPQNEDPHGLGEAAPKKAVVSLPAGMAVNPSAAGGLGACTPAEIGLGNGEAPSCPESSKVGTVEIDTPTLEQPLVGSVYEAQQANNPFGSLLALYVAAEEPVSGVRVKVAGQVTLDPITGQLTTTFDNIPQQPFSDFKLSLFGGSRAVLVNPSTCGSYTASGELTPYSSQTPTAVSSTFVIDQGCAATGFSPSFTAGTINNQAGAFAPFTLTLSRQDSEQELNGLQETFAPGLSARLAGVPLCGESEAAGGTCPAASQIGTVTVAAGAGPEPIWVKGTIYLTGPYKGGPFGEAVEIPAIAGPFNLDENGKPVTVRGSIRIDPVTAQASVVSDPFPRILQGIPLKVKTVNVTLDRTGFTFNPTSCNPERITGAVTGAQGVSVAVSSPFQAANCATLAFRPKLVVSTAGRTSRTNGASLHVKLTFPKTPQGSEANIRSVKVDLPKALPSRLKTLQKACLAATFNANPASCPAASKVGTAKAITPILPVPLTGPAYFVSHGGEAFPRLIVVLQGDGVTVELVGDTFISKAGITSSTFRTIPDVPVGTFELNLPEGKYSALAANGNLCKSKLAMPTAFTAQNGAVIKQSTPITATGCPKKHKAKAKSKTKKKK